MPVQKSLHAPDQVAVLAEVIRHVMVNLNCVNVATITAVDFDNQTVDAQHAIKQVLEQKPDGSLIYQNVTVMSQLPFVVMRGGGSHITFPIAVGDNCLVLINDREIDNWFQSGGTQAPTTFRAHDLSDGFAIVGVSSLQNLIQNYFEGIELLYNANTYMRMTDGAVEIKGNVRIVGNLSITGTVSGDGGGTLNISSDMTQTSGKVFKAGNGVSGTFNIVTSAFGVVTGGS